VRTTIPTILVISALAAFHPTATGAEDAHPRSIAAEQNHVPGPPAGRPAAPILLSVEVIDEPAAEPSPLPRPDHQRSTGTTLPLAIER
jgi:hypothetical protein